MKIGPLVTKFCHLALWRPVIIYDSPCSNNFASSTALAEVCALLSVILVEMTLHLHSYLQGIDPGVTRGQISPNMERMGHIYRCPLPKVLACYENLCEWYHGYVITADTAGNTENGVYTVTRGMTQISELSLRTSIFFGSRALTLKPCNESNPCHK